MIEWIKRNKEGIIRAMFLIPILSVATISISHVVSWYDLANPISWAVYLSVAVEIAAMSAIAAASVKVKGFSVEALLSHKLIKASSQIDLEKHIEDLSENEVNVLLGQIKALIRKDKRYGKGQRIEMESYSDYGSGISNNAQKGIDLNDKNNNKCATPVGKVRAQQLAKGEPISVETIKRMYSDLSRAETYYDETDMNACGTISYLMWGGKAALSWSRNKLRELGLIEAEANPSITSTYPGQIASGSISPALIGKNK